jgi:pimeloyl-ACP methyl ester carboxylesterase
MTQTSQISSSPSAASSLVASEQTPKTNTHSAPLAQLEGLAPPAPTWFEQALAMPPKRGEQSVQDASIETLSWGTPGKPGLLLMHGNSAHADWYSYLAPLLANDFHVLALSFSGMGGSSWREQYAVAQWADEAIAVAQSYGFFDGAVKPVFFAHSFGGFPLMNITARFGDRLRLAVIADTPIHTRKEREKKVDDARQSIFRPHRIYLSAKEAIARFRLMPPQACANLFILDHIARTSLKEVHVEDSKQLGWTWKFDPALFRSFKMGKPGADLLQARCPVAWLNGGRSKLIDSDVLSNIATYSPPGTPVIELPDADHHLMIDQPLAFVEALRDLISRY